MDIKNLIQIYTFNLNLDLNLISWDYSRGLFLGILIMNFSGSGKNCTQRVLCLLVVEGQGWASRAASGALLFLPPSVASGCPGMRPGPVECAMGGDRALWSAHPQTCAVWLGIQEYPLRTTEIISNLNSNWIVWLPFFLGHIFC